MESYKREAIKLVQRLDSIKAYDVLYSNFWGWRMEERMFTFLPR